MPLSGATLGSRCYPSNESALDAYYSNVSPAQTPGATSYVLLYEKTGDVWQQKSYAIQSSGFWTLRSVSSSPVLIFPPCDPTESFDDGMALGWGVAAAIVAAWVVKNLRRGL